jgi:hypothetical protein
MLAKANRHRIGYSYSERCRQSNTGKTFWDYDIHEKVKSLLSTRTSTDVSVSIPENDDDDDNSYLPSSSSGSQDRDIPETWFVRTFRPKSHDDYYPGGWSSSVFQPVDWTPAHTDFDQNDKDDDTPIIRIKTQSVSTERLGWGLRLYYGALLMLLIFTLAEIVINLPGRLLK